MFLLDEYTAASQIAHRREVLQRSFGRRRRSRRARPRDGRRPPETT